MAPEHGPLIDSLILNRLSHFYHGHITRKNLPIGTPVFRISNTVQELASWNPQLRVITLSRSLLNVFTSHAVEYVLLHEMAHQVVTDVFRLPGDHGPAFQRACHWVGVPQGLRHASISLEILNSYENMNGEKDPADTVLLRRVEKLLALSQSSNEHEALLAMKKVQELMSDDHMMRLKGLGGPGKAIVVREDLKTSKVPSYVWIVLSILTTHYFVKSIAIRGFDPKTGRDTVYIELVGQKLQANMALYVYHFLTNKVAQLWAHYKKENQAPNRFKLSYINGLLKGFLDKLNSFQSPSNQALVSLKDPLVEQFYQERYPNVVSHSVKTSSQFYASVYEEGKEEGKNIVINKPLNTQKAPPQPLSLK